MGGGLTVKRRATVVMKRSVISYNNATWRCCGIPPGSYGARWQAAGVFVDLDAHATFEHVNMSHNWAEWDAGAFYSLGVDVRVLSCNFHDNDSRDGPAAILVTAGNATFHACHIHSNRNRQSAAVKADAGSHQQTIGVPDVFRPVNMSMSDCKIHHNYQVHDLWRWQLGNNQISGGGLFVDVPDNPAGPSIVTLNRCEIFDNTAAQGGGVCVGGGHLSLNDCDIHSNEAERGGGLAVIGGIVTLTRTLVDRNRLVPPQYVFHEVLRVFPEASGDVGANVFTQSILYYLLPTPPGHAIADRMHSPLLYSAESLTALLRVGFADCVAGTGFPTRNVL